MQLLSCLWLSQFYSILSLDAVHLLKSDILERTHKLRSLRLNSDTLERRLRFRLQCEQLRMKRFKLRVLLQGLTLLLLSPTCRASSLGMTVHVVPQDSSRGETVRAHFSAITPSPCPDISNLCAAGEDCLIHTTSLPFNSSKPDPGWCVRQWQKTVASNYSGSISVGIKTNLYVAINAIPKVRANSGRLNQPAFVALPPPLRARVNCPHHFYLSVKDLDGDKVQCRFAQAEQGECVSCAPHPFIELDNAKCMLTFTGQAPAGQYFIYLMAEDFIPVPKISQVTSNTPLSSVPVHLSLTVDASSTSCTDEPVAIDGTPAEHSVQFVLPYQQVTFNVNYMSQLESISEIAVVGPPELFRVDFKSVGPLATMTMAWVRSENKLARLLPICFVANTKSLQSEPRCMWLYQREMRTLPAGTELTCEKTEMTLVLPVASLTNIKLDELQLNSPSCPVSYNDTYLVAHISLSGCGTKTVHAGSELVYTNTLQSVRPYTMVSRQPSLILPLACRIPAVQAKGPQYKISMPTQVETFGYVQVWIEFHLPGEGPMSKFTGSPRFLSRFQSPVRVRRGAEPGAEASNTTSSGSANTTSTNTTSTDSANTTPTPSTNTTSTNSSGSSKPSLGSRISQLDLHLLSNCSVDRAEMIVRSCKQSATEDMASSSPILDGVCRLSNSTLEIVTTTASSKVYRLDLSSMASSGTMMYVQCEVSLCIATMPSQKCPDLCSRSISQKTLVGSVFTSIFTVKSGPISLVVTTAAPATTTVSTTATAQTPTQPTTAAATTTTTKPTTNKPSSTTAPGNTATQATTTTSHAPQQASSVATGAILTTIGLFLQKLRLC
ncbi:mucin-3A-like [Parambassis ranga]|uniref:Mucin-3A-like n=1 Tax=Parambassis ranga TaxID=210632 RepID=A0A6P7HZE0_9TELE|nr:mucin-3A-like [Parambassis ranga]